ncbi:hypothetical protein AMATHDRAFT_49545 [Amanita thiersii Skay4041]|uniref:Uncharacterized protein n=1 Tax=Amanita thiersii Skay4041 TaxID=703135 RepID=A0A2A9NBJ5_9AGAR|nr:hypothetical protein AMATHDRAFT_49545 [Amanita thiersii Skay4041]
MYWHDTKQHSSSAANTTRKLNLVTAPMNNASTTCNDIGLSNRVYLPEEVEAIRCSIAGTENKLASLDHQIRQLQQQRNQLLVEISKGQVALAPHKILPEDVIRYIFILSADDAVVFLPHEFGRLADEPRRIPTQLSVSLVCSNWRRIALNTPQLWTSFGITTRPTERVPLTRYAHQWFTRAHGLPVSFRTDYLFSLIQSDIQIGGDLAERQADIQALKTLLGSFQLRRLSLQVVCNDPEQLNELFQDERVPEQPAKTLVEVEDLTLMVSCLQGAVVWDFLPCNFPNLRYLRLTALRRLTGGIRLATPWHQLLHLDLFSCPISASWCLDTLGECKSLERCKLNVCPSGLEPLVTGPVVVPHLQELELNFVCCSSANDFLLALDLPRLESLTMWLGNSSTCWPITPNELIAKRLRLSQLQELKFRYSEVTLYDVAALLESAPRLQLIELPNWVVLDQETMDRLSKCELGPFLDTIVVNGELDNVEDFIVMVKKRQANVERMEQDSGREIAGGGQIPSAFKFARVSCKRDRLEAALILKRRLGVDVVVADSSEMPSSRALALECKLHGGWAEWADKKQIQALVYGTEKF